MEAKQIAVIPFRVGGWLPTDRSLLKGWLRNLAAEAKEKKLELAPVLVEFKQLIETDPELYMLFTLMFQQVPYDKEPFNKDPTNQPEVKTYDDMLELVNLILTKPPEFNIYGLVGFPINAILDWAMGTQAGLQAFMNRKVNDQIKKVLNVWGDFLKSPDSVGTLNDHPRHGWFGEDAFHKMPNFVTNFKCDPKKPHYGYTSWDDFFIREFNDNQRHVDSPNDDSVIVNGCESAPFAVATKVKKIDTFWIKGQPYSLQHMLNNDPLVDNFVGGTVYQAFLSATNYHRWHSPISGKVLKTEIIDGTYYSEAAVFGFYPLDPLDPNHRPDDSAPNSSQGYLAEVATRGVIYIKADNPKIGLVAIVFIGMAEVSSNQFIVKADDHVKKGQQIGMFHFGGSTHCVVFGPQVKLNWGKIPENAGLTAQNINVNSKIAVVLD